MAESIKEKTFNEAWDALHVVFPKWMDDTHKKTGLSKEMILAMAGKAMVLEGAVMLGSALHLQSEPSMDLARDMLQGFRKLHDDRKRGAS
jgi:hypothetical protein